jgi:predicted nucleic acid-binding protein
MDERRGRAAAEARGLLPIGTLNILDLADERGHLDGLVALDALRQTTFRADNQLLDRFDARMKDRRT